MSIPTLITRGLGTFGSVADVIRRGLDAAVALLSPDCIQETLSAITDTTAVASTLQDATPVLSSLSDTNIVLGVLCS